MLNPPKSQGITRELGSGLDFQGFCCLDMCFRENVESQDLTPFFLRLLSNKGGSVIILL
jgi:hypothetical protein